MSRHTGDLGGQKFILTKWPAEHSTGVFLGQDGRPHALPQDAVGPTLSLSAPKLGTLLGAEGRCSPGQEGPC